MPTTSTDPRAAAAALLVPGTTCHGFAVERCETVPELDSDAYVLRHTASGARLLYLSCDDENKAFAIGFKTPPADSTGVFHILEHSVLCGSAKFPVKEPFVDLIKSSMQTFLNGQGGLAHTDRAAVLGILSLVFWSITLITTVKYVFIAMRFYRTMFTDEGYLTLTLPVLASYRRGMSETSVDLPLPVPPIMPSVLPSGSSSVTSLTALAAPAPNEKLAWLKLSAGTGATLPGLGSATGWLPSSVMPGTQLSTSLIRDALALALVKTTTRLATYTMEVRVCVM